MSMDNNFVCPCCLFRFMKVGIDKKGRPYFNCTSCATRIFQHGGALGAHAVANTLRMLDNPNVLEAIRRASFEDLDKGSGQGLHTLLGINAGSVTTITAAPEAAPLRKVG